MGRFYLLLRGRLERFAPGAMAWLMHSRAMGWQAAWSMFSKPIRHERLCRSSWRVALRGLPCCGFMRFSSQQ